MIGFLNNSEQDKHKSNGKDKNQKTKGGGSIQCQGFREDPVCTSRRICLWWKGNGDGSTRARSYSIPNDTPIRNTQTFLLLLHHRCCFHYHWHLRFFPGSPKDSSRIRRREPLSSTQAMSSPWSRATVQVVVWFFFVSSQCFMRFCFLALFNYGGRSVGSLIPIVLYEHPLIISHVTYTQFSRLPPVKSLLNQSFELINFGWYYYQIFGDDKILSF